MVLFIYTGKRHNEILCDKSRPFGYLRCAQQGFVTDSGEFLDRKAAADYAILHGQIKKQTLRLTSEDLW
jgi:hypothetical protein